MDGLFGTRAIARELGVSPGTISKAVKSGRLSPVSFQDGRPMFELEAARAAMSPNIGAPQPTPPSVPDDEDGGGGETDDNVRYRKARADKEEALAEQEILELGRLRKELLPASEIIIAWSQLFRACSQNLSGLPQKLLSRYPGLTEEGREFLRETLRTILDDLSTWEPA